MGEKNNDKCLEYKVSKNYNDNTIKKMLLDKYDVDDLIRLPIRERNKIIKDIYNELDVSLRQLGRVLGVGKAVEKR